MEQVVEQREEVFDLLGLDKKNKQIWENPSHHMTSFSTFLNTTIVHRPALSTPPSPHRIFLAQQLPKHAVMCRLQKGLQV
jgi:hypothetical protein